MKQEELQKFALYGFAAYGVYCLYQRYQAQQAAMAGIHMGAIQMNPDYRRYHYQHSGQMGQQGYGAVHMGGAHQMGMIH